MVLEACFHLDDVGVVKPLEAGFDEEVEGRSLVVKFEGFESEVFGIFLGIGQENRGIGLVDLANNLKIMAGTRTGNGSFR